MASYENPEVAIDTQSGQHWRNLQQSLSSSFAGVNEALISRNKAEWAKTREDEKEFKTDIKGRVKEAEKTFENIFTTGKNLAPTSNYSAMADGLKKIKDLKIEDFKRGQTTNEEVDKMVSDFEKSLVSTQKAIAIISSQGDIAKAAAAATPGTEGSFYLDDPTTRDFYEKLGPVYEGKKPVAFIFEKSAEGADILNVNGFKYNTNGLAMGNEIGETPFLVTPMYSKEIPNIANNSALSDMLNIEKDKITFKKGFYTEIPGPSTSVDTNGIQTKKVTTILAKPDEAAIMGNPNFANAISQAVGGWVNGDTRAATAYYNTIIVPNWNLDPANKGKEIARKEDVNTKFTDAETANFQKGYAKAFIRTIGTNPIATQAAGNVQEVELTKDPNAKNKSGNKTPTKWETAVSKNTALYNKYKAKGFPAKTPLFSINAQDPQKYVIFKNDKWYLMQAGGKSTKAVDLETLDNTTTKSDAVVSTFPNTPEGSRDAFSAIGFN